MACNYPLSDLTSLKEQFVGKALADLPTPSLLLDRSLIKRNCTAMLQVCRKLNVGFRAHVKSHKTLELSKMMVGDDPQDQDPDRDHGVGGRAVDFIVSTLAEAEALAGYVREVQGRGKKGSVRLPDSFICCSL